MLRVEVDPATTGLLFFTAWIIYLADRLADSFTLDFRRPTSLRHRFCLRHRPVLIGMIGLAVGSNVWLLSHGLDSGVLKLGAAVGVSACAYLVGNFLFGRAWQTLPGKELIIGLLFAAGTLTPLLPRSWPVGTDWLWTFSLFVALAVFNCISIAVWERGIDQEQSRVSIATAWPGVARYSIAIGVVIATAALALSRWSALLSVPNSCIAVSAVALVALHFFSQNASRDEQTALADLVLLTPLLMLAASRVPY